MRLKVSSHLGLLFDLEVKDKRVTYHFVETVMQSSVLRWVEQGVIIWEPASGELSYDKFDAYNSVQTRVRPNESHFIYALETYLAKQFNQFTYELIDDNGGVQSLRLPPS